jgi:hypothetical protein
MDDRWRGHRVRRGAAIVTGCGAVLALAVASVAYANVRVTPVSHDPYTNTTAYHQTEVEPDTFSFGNTIVADFQVGRFNDGGSSNIGWSTSADGGTTWQNGFLPGTTIYANPPGPFQRATDPTVSYDPKHDVWLLTYLGSLANFGFTGNSVLASRSTDGGLTWGNPVTIKQASGFQNFDASWSSCDQNAGSPFYGNCYAEWDDFGQGNPLHMSTSTDGGLTWTEATIPPGTSVIGGRPVSQPNGRVVMPIANGSETSIQSFVSTNGGVSDQGPVPVDSVGRHFEAGGLRTHMFPSADVDAGGTVYAIWHDCRFESGCSANDIVLTTSANGNSWTPTVRIPVDPIGSGVDHFMPGIAVEPGTSGATAHLAVTYYFYPDTNCTTGTCRLSYGFTESLDGGATWSAGLQVSGPFKLEWLPNTTQGYMVTDFSSVSWVTGGWQTVFAGARRVPGKICTLGDITSCDEPMIAPKRPLAGGSTWIRTKAEPRLWFGASAAVGASLSRSA